MNLLTQTELVLMLLDSISLWLFLSANWQWWLMRQGLR